jgi:hypothetical protein
MTLRRVAALARAIWQTVVSHPSHAVITFAVLVVLVRGTLFVTDLIDRHHAAIATAERSARSFAEVLSEHTARTFEAVDLTLREVELIRRDDEAGRYPTAKTVHDALRHLQQTSPVLVAIGWTNAAGELQAHSYEQEPPMSNLAGLSHFIAQRVDMASRPSHSN